MYHGESMVGDEFPRRQRGVQLNEDSIVTSTENLAGNARLPTGRIVTTLL